MRPSRRSMLRRSLITGTKAVRPPRKPASSSLLPIFTTSPSSTLAQPARSMGFLTEIKNIFRKKNVVRIAIPVKLFSTYSWIWSFHLAFRLSYRLAYPSSHLQRITPLHLTSSPVLSILHNPAQVGEDPDGNVYYLHDPGYGQALRRMVEYKDPIPDPAKLHMLWSSWLRNRREHPPTPQEIAKYERDRVLLAARVKDLEEADAKLRAQEQLEKAMNGGEEPGAPTGPQFSLERVMASLQQADAKAAQEYHDNEQQQKDAAPK